MRGTPSKRRVWRVGKKAHGVRKKNGPLILIELKNASHQIRCRQFNRAHVIVQNSLLASIVPLYGNAGPIPFGNGAPVGLIALPANTITNGEMS